VRTTILPDAARTLERPVALPAPGQTRPEEGKAQVSQLGAATYRASADIERIRMWTTVESLWTALLASPLAGGVGEPPPSTTKAKPGDAITRSPGWDAVAGRGRVVGELVEDLHQRCDQ
jgi:hypothetical protein